MTFEERLKAQEDKYASSVEYQKEWFRKNNTEVKTTNGITFVGKASHQRQLEENEALRKAGFKISSSGPEYDGMTRWYVHLTKDVQL